MSEHVGQHYKDAAGAAYFGWQKSVGEIGGILNVRKFEKYISSSDTVVDFGCGTGALLSRLEAKSRVGIEPNEHARRDTRARGIDCVESPSEIADAFADVVISNHALEHTLNPYGELHQLLRILKPGARIVIYVPLDDFRNQPKPEHDQNHHVYTWTPLLLRNLMTEVGFVVDSSEVVTHAWPPATRLFVWLPAPVFDLVARVWSVGRRRRQVTVVALRPIDSISGPGERVARCAGAEPASGHTS